MLRPGLQRLRIHLALPIARRRVSRSVPLSPAWDAAIGRLEDLERERWRLDHPEAQTVGQGPSSEPSRS
jgi:hypothetical protein